MSWCSRVWMMDFGRLHRGRHRLGATLAITALLLTGCTSGGRAGQSDPSPASAARPDFPERKGEPVVIAGGSEGGREWELVGQESTAGTCLEISDSDGGLTIGCGFEVPELHDIAFLRHESKADEAMAIVAGPVVSDARRVRLQFKNGERQELEPINPVPPFETSFFVADSVPIRNLVAVVVVGPGGRSLERRPV